MYGAKWVGNLNGGTAPISKKFYIKASEVITKGDFLTIDDATGKVDVAATDEPLLGIASETVTGNAAGSNKVEVLFAIPGTLWMIDADGTMTNADVGEWHALVGTTGIQQVDADTGAAVPTSTIAQFVLLEWKPQGYGADTDASMGIYTPAYTYFTANTASA